MRISARLKTKSIFTPGIPRSHIPILMLSLRLQKLRKPLRTAFQIIGLHILRQITQQKCAVQVLFHLLPMHDPPAFFQRHLLAGSGVMVEPGCFDEKRKDPVKLFFLLEKFVFKDPQKLFRYCPGHVCPVRLSSAQLCKVQIFYKKAVPIGNDFPGKTILLLPLKRRLLSADLSVFQPGLLVDPGTDSVAATRADSSVRKIIVLIHAPMATFHILNQLSLFLFQSAVFFRKVIHRRRIL